MRHRAQKSITGPERRKERETFCVRYGKWTRFLRWRTQLHKTTRNASRFSIYIALLDVLESRVMKRTSISYCAMRDFECGYSGSKTLQCEVLSLRWESQPNFCNSICLKFFYHYNVYIIMIFYVFILKYYNIGVSRSFSF